ncbi:MAG: CNNM domain-containing protein [Saprospiraceae bacterium]|nr:hemolysin [Saprospirales bacterium]
MSLLIGFFLLSIIFSFLCSVWEAVLLSITPSFIKRMETERPPLGALIKKLKEDIDRPLSAILTLNTIAHTVGAIGVGAQAGKLFGSQSIQLAGFSLSYESIIAALMTLAILFLSEIIPKTIGANNWRSLAGFTARSLNMLVVILKPFVWLSYKLTRMLKKDKSKSVFSKQDFAAMTEVVSESGALEQADIRLIKNLLKFDDLTAQDVMTPRTVMVMADEDQTLEEFYQESRPLQYSRIPLYKDNPEKITGLLLKNDLLDNMLNGKKNELLRNLKRPVAMVPYNMSLRKVFEKLQGKREHLAIVVDEFGGPIGLITLEDVIETLLGLEIMDETDSIADLQQYARNLWKERSRKLGMDTAANPPKTP